MSISRFNFVILFVFMSFGLIAQTAVEMPMPTSELMTLIDGHIQKYVDEGKLPGGVFMVNKDGKNIYNKSFGNNAENDPYQSDDIFRIASMTKAFTSVAIMQLVEQGKVDLDATVSTYIPAFANTQVLDEFNAADSTFTTKSVENPITVRHLMSHTSGIYYPAFSPGKLQAISAKIGTGLYGLAGMNSTMEMVNHLAMQPLAHEPGAQWTYGLNMEIMGGIVATVSGKTLQQYFIDHIMDAIGIEDTRFYLPEDKHSRLVNLYAPAAPGKLVVNPDPNMAFPLLPDHDHYAGGGGMSGTAGDYMTFIETLRKDGTEGTGILLKKESVDQIVTDQLAMMNVTNRSWLAMEKMTFGLGFSLTTEESLGSFSPGTYAWGGYFNTKFWIDPVQNLTFVGMTNVLPFQHNEFWNELYALIYQAVEVE